MPFVSKRQRKFMWAKHPDIAREWTQEYGSKPRKPQARPKAKKKGQGRAER